MPVYVYACPQCHDTEEVLQSSSAPAPGICRGCGYQGGLTRVPQRTSARVQRTDLEDEGTQGMWERHKTWMKQNPDWAERNTDQHHQYSEARFGA